MKSTTALDLDSSILFRLFVKYENLLEFHSCMSSEALGGYDARCSLETEESANIIKQLHSYSMYGCALRKVLS